MANLSGFFDIGDSLAIYLRRAMPGEWNADVNLVGTKTLTNAAPALEPSLTLCLYRTLIDEHTRNTRLRNAPDRQPPLSLELHYMLTSWAADVEKEHQMLIWAMDKLHRMPVLDASTLKPSGGWAADEVIHLVPLDLSIEDTMRIWDAWAPTYRLSVCYAARVLRIDSSNEAQVPVVSRRLALGDDDLESGGA